MDLTDRKPLETPLSGESACPMSNTGLMWSPFLQPPANNSGRPYSYLNQKNIYRQYFPAQLPEGTLCWVLKRKGKKKRSDGGDLRIDVGSSSFWTELFLRARGVSDEEVLNEVNQ